MSASTTTKTQDGLLVAEVAELGGATTISLAGEVDLANSATLKALLESIDGATGAIVVDLERLEFIDSSGLHVLLSAYRETNCDGDGCLRFVPSRSLSVQRLLRVTGLDAALPFVDDRRR